MLGQQGASLDTGGHLRSFFLGSFFWEWGGVEWGGGGAPNGPPAAFPEDCGQSLHPSPPHRAVDSN